MSTAADQIADRIEAALARIEAATARDAGAAQRLKALEAEVERSIADLDVMIEAG
ncbi:hypothetical protein [Glacieibacterium sp.]|uniref:hypothetical protein n=1 Tax=Glacieibacterium sp. TaxID=2860237 RepID=UPI003B0050DA